MEHNCQVMQSWDDCRKKNCKFHAGCESRFVFMAKKLKDNEQMHVTKGIPQNGDRNSFQKAECLILEVLII